MLNWYKIANMWDEIEKFGPNSPVESIDDPRVEYIAENMGMTKEKAFHSLRDRLMAEFYKREYFVKNYGWSIPSQEAIEEIKSFVGNETVLEVGAGYGMWAKLMREAGIKIVATDLPFGNESDIYRPRKVRFTEIEEIDSEVAVQKYMYQPYTLMMSWPPYAESMAAKTLKGFKGNKLIFIGEGEGGCTGDDQLFNILRNEWTLVKEIDIPQWYGIHDYISLWQRK
jgi:hypothetical protein